MRLDSERDIKKSEKRRELPREERGRRAKRCREEERMERGDAEMAAEG